MPKLLRDPSFLLRLYKACLGRGDIEEIFLRKFDRSPTLSIGQFHSFLANEHRDKRLNEVLHPPISEEAAARIVSECQQAAEPSQREQLSEDGFLRFLLGPHNLAVRKDLYEPNENQLNRPLRCAIGFAILLNLAITSSTPRTTLT